MAYTDYATIADVTEYLGSEGPTDTARLIKRASELIANLTKGNSDLTNADHVEALKLATCAQIEYWMQASEAISILNGVNSISIGSFSVDFGESSGKAATLAPRARVFLNNQYLLYRGSVTL